MSMPSIIYEDKQLLIVEKPPGWLAQPDGSSRQNVLTWGKEYLVVSCHKPGQAYLGLCHRLDRVVGGLIVLAKTSKSAGRLSMQFREHSIGKHYYAICQGVPVGSSGSLEQVLVRDGDMTRLAQEKGARAALNWRLLATGRIGQERGSWLEIELITGFKHQIRAQLSIMGHPLWGDFRYGAHPASVHDSIGLWAHRLSLDHPITHEKMTFSTEPRDIWPWNAWQGD